MARHGGASVHPERNAVLKLLRRVVPLTEDYEGQPDAVRAITQRFTSALERGVRRCPEQYFWLHRRWKHEPPKLKRRSAA